MVKDEYLSFFLSFCTLLPLELKIKIKFFSLNAADIFTRVAEWWLNGG
jgi:hypothetical protein